MSSQLKYPYTNYQSDSEFLTECRTTGLRRLRTLCVVQLILSFVSFDVGIGTLVVAWPNKAFPYVSGGPIFSGVLVFIGALLGYWASNEGLHSRTESSFPRKVKCWIIAHYTLCITCISLCILSIGYALWSLLGCVNDDVRNPWHKHCFPNYNGNIVMAIMGMIIGLMLAITCIVGAVFFCCYGRAYGLRSHDENIIQAKTPEVAQSNQIQQWRCQVQGHF